MVDACNALNPTHQRAPLEMICPLSAQLAGLNTATCMVSPASSTIENVFPNISSSTSNNFRPWSNQPIAAQQRNVQSNYVL